MQQTTDAPPPKGSAPPDPDSAIGRHAAMTVVRTAAAATAGWSLYVVARHYDVPPILAIGAGLVFDGVAYLCLRMATDAMRAARSAAAPIAATLGMASTSVYLNLVHARLTGGGRPAEVLYASPAVALLLVSVLSWAAERATARASRGESPMRLPAFGALGWVLAREEAGRALKERAVAHVTGTVPSSAIEPARRPRPEIDTVDAIRIASDTHPQLDSADLAQLLATYGITVDALHVALVLGRAAVPSVRLDRVPAPDPAPLPRPTGQAELTPAGVMRGEAPPDMPQVSGLPLSEAIPAIHRRLVDDVSAKAVVQCLALQGMATDTGYVRTALSRARLRAHEEAAEEDARLAAAARTAERSSGTGFYP